MMNVDLNNREIILILDLLENRIDFGVGIDLTREYLSLYDKLNAKKIR